MSSRYATYLAERRARLVAQLQRLETETGEFRQKAEAGHTLAGDPTIFAQMAANLEAVSCRLRQALKAIDAEFQVRDLPMLGGLLWSPLLVVASII